MSHFTTVKTRMTDLDCLESALSYLGFQHERGPCAVKDYEGAQIQVELAVRGDNYDIGFRLNEEEYEIVADWWSAKHYGGLEEKQTVEKIRQRYAYEKIMKEKQRLREKGFVLSREEITEENIQVITLHRD